MLLLLGPIAALTPLRWPWVAAIALATPALGNLMLYGGGGTIRPGDVALSFAISGVLTGAAYGARVLLARRKHRDADHAA